MKSLFISDAKLLSISAKIRKSSAIFTFKGIPVKTPVWFRQEKTASLNTITIHANCCVYMLLSRNIINISSAEISLTFLVLIADFKMFNSLAQKLKFFYKPYALAIVSLGYVLGELGHYLIGELFRFWIMNWRFFPNVVFAQINDRRILIYY